MSLDFPRDILLKHAWSSHDLQDLKIVIISRGSPGNRSVIEGSMIQRVGRSFMEMEDGTMIPFHRITEILENERPVWKRKSVNQP
ncbi:MAG: DUF504 domain-containing protein [Thermoplasmatota archaeon]